MAKTVALVTFVCLARVLSLSSFDSISRFGAQTTSVVYLVTMLPMRSQWDGIYTNEQARRGETLYAENCGACHGMGLGGGFGPPLTGPRFLAKWRDRSLGELFELMRITMPPTFPGGFGRQQSADMLAFILQKGKSPAGSTELVGDPEVLNHIRLVPEK